MPTRQPIRAKRRLERDAEAVQKSFEGVHGFIQLSSGSEGPGSATPRKMPNP
jgi:hypothetical protein